MKTKFIILIYSILLFSNVVYSQLDTVNTEKDYLTFGIFIGKIEEGARIFTPVRLLPFGHPEALTHEFPTATQLYGSEFQTLLLLGEKCGLKLWATLSRFPQKPSPDWPYPEFEEPPLNSLMNAEIIHKLAEDSPLPGLRALAYYNNFPVCFIVDTRNLSLAERGMDRASAMGLDIKRAEFINELENSVKTFKIGSTGIIVFDK